MKDKLISTDVAVAAKDLGFPQDIQVGVMCKMRNFVNKRYIKIREIRESDLENEWCIFDEVYVTQSLLQKWLREEHKLHICIYPQQVLDKTMYCLLKHKHSIDFRKMYDTYEECLEEGLIEGLQTLKREA